MDNICNFLILLVGRVRIELRTNGLGHLSSYTFLCVFMRLSAFMTPLQCFLV
jgi:hypothetical protein